MIALLARAALALEVVCAPDAGSGIVGVPPVAVECLVTGTAGATWDEVRWSFGEGTPSTGTVGLHRYERPGTFEVAAELLGFRETAASAPVDVRVSRPAYVTVCPPPEARFRWWVVSGPVIGVADTSLGEGCVTGRAWTVTDADGRVVFASSGAADDLVLLPGEGRFTVRLDVQAVAGPAAAEATVVVGGEPGWR